MSPKVTFRRSVVMLAFCLVLPAVAKASVQLTYVVRDRPVALHWPLTALPLTYSVGSDFVRAASGAEQLVARSLSSWSGIPEGGVRFTPLGVAERKAGRDGTNNISLSDTLFSNSGFVAYTTTWYDDSGAILEADIQIDSSVVKESPMSVQNLIEHEAGHLLGLDHSGVISSAMFPYVPTDVALELDGDDQVAIANLYPPPGSNRDAGAIRGSVLGSGGGVFGAQVVAMNEKGTPVASVLSAKDGTFELKGLPEGNYTLYTEPLDGPVDQRNLSPYWQAIASSRFQTGFAAPQTLALSKTGSHDGIILRTNDLAPALNPRWIGTFPPGSREIRLNSRTATLRPGQSVSIAFGGDGVIGGMTTFSISSPNVSRVSDFQYGSNYVWATFRVDAATPPGSLVVVAKSGNETATLTGALRVEQKSRGRIVAR